MIDFKIHTDIKQIFPDISVGILTGKISNSDHHPGLWKLIDEASHISREKYTFESIRDIQAIKDGKTAYRSLGKDPNRYRVSAEALLRRIVKGQSLYQIHTLVDVLNLVSIETGVTIGGFDLELVKTPITLGIGKENEEFEAIGRGALNVHRLPIYRDHIGAIGSPTSDCTRTMLRLETVNFLMIVTGFYGDSYIQPCLDNLKQYLVKFAEGKNFKEQIEY